MESNKPVKVKVTQSCLTRCNPMDHRARVNLQARILEPIPSPGDLPKPGIEPCFLALQVDSLPAEPQGKPKNTGVGSLSLLQQIFPTQKSNWGLLHCRWIFLPTELWRKPLTSQGHTQWKVSMLGPFWWSSDYDSILPKQGGQGWIPL